MNELAVPAYHRGVLKWDELYCTLNYIGYHLEVGKLGNNDN